MARFTAVVDSPRPQEEVFAYLADFSNAEEWDPGTDTATRIGLQGPIERGSRFRLTFSFVGQESELEYEIVELDEPTRVVLVGENAHVRSHDVIRVEPHGDGCRVTYDAELTLKGLAKLVQPALGPLFNKLGRDAADGLRDTLAGSIVRAG